MPVTSSLRCVLCSIAILAGVAERGLAQDPLPPDPTWARIKKEGKLRWGADPSGGAPYVFVNPRNPDEVIGFELEIMEKVAERLDVKLELVRGDWDALPDSLRANHIDLAFNGLEVLPERAKTVRFTTPYYVFIQQLTVRAADKDKYRSLQDLQGKPIAVLTDSASMRVLQDAGWNASLIVTLKDSQTPYEALKTRPGEVEAVLAESIIAKYYAGKDRELHNVTPTFSFGVYAGAVRDDSPQLLAALNRILEDMKRSGELGQIYQRWGVWSKEQNALGISMGAPVTAIDLAQGDLDSDATGWLVIVPKLLDAALYTLFLTVVSMPLAVALGLALALLGRSRRWWLSRPARVYIQVVRGTPLLVQVYLVYFTLPRLGEALGLGGMLTWPPLIVGVLCLAGNYAAYEAEIHRAGIDAVPKGQREAALSLGLSERQTFCRIILPQSFRIILPPVFNDLISMLKDSCIVSVISVPELLYVALSIGKARFNVPEMLVAAAVIYLILSLAADRLGKLLERRLKLGGAPHVQARLAPH